MLCVYLIKQLAIPFWKMMIRWENGLGGSGGYERIFLVIP
jgi:hypothetical protein